MPGAPSSFLLLEAVMGSELGWIYYSKLQLPNQGDKVSFVVAARCADE